MLEPFEAQDELKVRTPKVLRQSRKAQPSLRDSREFWLDLAQDFVVG
jgi:hypothetical protein